MYLLFINQPSLLGEYYLTSSIIAGYSVLGGAELAMFFTIEGSKRYHARVVLMLLIKRLAIVNMFLFVPSAAVLAISIGNVNLAVLTALALVIEALSYEIGRYYWSIGRHELISVRDFIRPTIFALGIFISIYSEGVIISTLGVTVFLVANFLHVLCELLFVLASEEDAEAPVNCEDDAVRESGYRHYIRTVGPHFFQNQMLAYSLVAERSLLLAWAGASFLGFYGMWFSITSAVSQLISFPWLVNLKAEILKWQTARPPANVFLHCVKVLPIILISSACGLVIAYIFSVCASYLNIELPQLGRLAFFVIFISSTAYAYSAIVAALYSHSSRFVVSQLWTLFAFLPIYGAAIVGSISSGFGESVFIGLLSIGLSSVLLLITRVVYFLRSQGSYL